MKDGSGSTTTGTITALSTDGRGVMRSEDGRVVFVPGALPGETVTARIRRSHRSYADAQLVTRAHSSPLRVTPACVHYDDCGGCQIQHLAAAEQGPTKLKWFLETCQRVGGFRGPAHEDLAARMSLLSLGGTGYRVRARLQLTPPVQATGSPWILGFAAGEDDDAKDLGRRSVVGITSCSVLHPDLAGALPILQDVLNKGSSLSLPREPLQLELTRCHGPWSPGGPMHNEPALALTLYRCGRKRIPLAAGQHRALQQALAARGLTALTSDILMIRPEVLETTLPLAVQESDLAPFPSHRLGFLQPHTTAPIAYRSWLRQRVALTHSDRSPPGILWDLYGGSGLLGLSLLPPKDALEQRPAVGSCVIVESNRHALSACPSPNSKGAVVLQPIETSDFLARAQAGGWPRPRWIIADPPRSGLGRDIVAALAGILRTKAPEGPADLFLVSCDGAAAARDLAELTQLGFCVEGLTVVDAFGQTRHYEVLSHLRWQGP